MKPTRGAAALAAGLALLTSARPAEGCSMCRCGDATFNALGTDVYVAGKFRLALDWDRYDKESGIYDSAGVDLAARRARRTLSTETGGTDAERENRLTATLSYSFGESVTAVARVPWSSRDLVSTPMEGGATTTSTSDLSDPEFTGLVRVWAAPFAPGVGRRAWVSLFGGVKTPWGRNDLVQNGERLDEHAQPGTGSTDLFAGLSAFYLADESSSLFSSFQYRRTGTNPYDYRYGNVTLANVGYERKVSAAFDAVLELNYRHAQQDRVDASGNVDPNTGGDVLYLSPRAIVDLGRGTLGRISVQLPIVRKPYGDQTEKVVVNAGLTYLF